jgi:hypothetical protein
VLEELYALFLRCQKMPRPADASSKCPKKLPELQIVMAEAPVAKILGVKKIV